MTGWLMLLWMVQAAGGSAGYAFDVRHDHAFGDCRGRVTIGNESVRYETDEEHSREWRYPDVESFEIVSHDELRVHTYESESVLELGRDRYYTFRLSGGELDAGVFRFLEERSPRPVRTRVVLHGDDAGVDDADGRVLQKMPVRHGHFLGGCQGTLTVSGNAIRYASEHPGHSRLWRLAGVETFASTGRFDLRISTGKETFHFDLKVPLGEDTYRHIWRRVYEPQLPARGGHLR